MQSYFQDKPWNGIKFIAVDYQTTYNEAKAKLVEAQKITIMTTPKKE